MQSVVQQAQQHMFQQLEQCMQQAYTGLTLGTPVRAKEYSKQSKKNNNTLVLTETKQIDLDNHPSQWEYDEDSVSGNAQPPPSPLPSSPDPESTTPKDIRPSTSGFGGARHKTELPTRATRSTAVILGRPAGSETDGEYEDYFNPRIFTCSRLITTNPAFAAAVTLHRPSVPHSIETVCRRPWDGHPHGRNTRSKKHLEDGQRKRLPKDTQIIKTRNSPQSTYVRQFQKLSPDHNLQVESDLFKRLDLATAFKGLTIVTFTDANLEDTPSTSNQQTYGPFHYPSPSPSPTTTEEIEDIPELVENQDFPLPDEVLDDNIPIEGSDWSPPSVAFLPQLGKRE